MCLCVLLSPSAVLKALDLPDLGDLQRSSPPDFPFLQVCNLPLLERDTNASSLGCGRACCALWGGVGVGVGAGCTLTNIRGWTCEPSERGVGFDSGVLFSSYETSG